MILRGIAISYLSSLMSNSMSERYYFEENSSIKSLHWNIRMFECFECSNDLNEVLRMYMYFEWMNLWGKQLKQIYRAQVSALCSYETKKPCIGQKDEGHRLRKQQSKNGMSSDCGTLQDWEDLCLKYLKECKNSSKRIWIFQRKLQKIETRTIPLD